MAAKRSALITIRQLIESLESLASENGDDMPVIASGGQKTYLRTVIIDKYSTGEIRVLEMGETPSEMFKQVVKVLNNNHVQTYELAVQIM